MNKFWAELFLSIAGCLASGVVFAATGHPELTSLPWPQIAVAVALAIWGGWTRTAENALIAGKMSVEFRLFYEIVRDCITASGIGFVIFGLCSSLGANLWITGSSLWMAGYMGSRLLVGIGDAVMVYIKRKGETL